MKILAISDLHGFTPKLQEADILVIAGDLLARGQIGELQKFNNWLKTNQHKFNEIIVIPGNHDFCFQEDEKESREICTSCHILIDEEITIDGIKFYGSPVTPKFGGWAFMHKPDKINEYWKKIPIDTDVLITHGPPYSILDKTDERVLAGCVKLLNQVGMIRPKLHIFGHIHEGFGIIKTKNTTFANVSVVNERYELVNSPIILEVE